MLNVFGVSGSDVAREIKRKAERAPKPRERDVSDAEMQERYRAWKMMLPDELRLRDAYQHHRVAASERRDRDAWEKWNEKLKQLRRHVLEREMDKQRATDRLDANTEQID